MRWVALVLLTTVLQPPPATAYCGPGYECSEICVDNVTCIVTERSYNGGCTNPSGSTWKGAELQVWAASWPGPFAAGAGESCYTGPEGSNASEHGFVAWYDNYGLYDDPTATVRWVECHNMWCWNDCYIQASGYRFPQFYNVRQACPAEGYPPHVLLP